MERAFKPLKGSLDNGVAILSGSWAIGSTGAVGTKTGGGGLTLSRSDVGTYSVQLNGNKGAAAAVSAILFFAANVVTSDADPSNDTAAIMARPLSKSASAGTMGFQTFDEAGVARDPASGAAIQFMCHVRISGAVR